LGGAFYCITLAYRVIEIILGANKQLAKKVDRGLQNAMQEKRKLIDAFLFFLK